MKIIFMGTPHFSIFSLKALIEAGHEILAVYTQPPRPAGRGQKEKKSPIHTLAEENGIEVRTPKKLGEKEIAGFLSLRADLAVVVAYGLILPKEIIDGCKCLNIHASLLPRWRGAAPIQRAIIAGDHVTGITIIHMDEGLDTGDMLLKKELEITDDTTGGELHDELSVLGSEAIIEAIEKLQKGELEPERQEGDDTYAKKISKDEELINWENSIWDISRLIRAFNPYPGAYFIYNGEKIKIIKARLEECNNDGETGYVIDNMLGIKCKDGIVRPTQVQRAGKKAMSALDMLRGFSIPEGSYLQ